MKAFKQFQVVAQHYACDGAFEEMLKLPRGKWIVAVNGGIPDARRKLSRVEAEQIIASWAEFNRKEKL